MGGKREMVQDFILKKIKEITPDKENQQLYIDMFKKMSNKEFDDFMQDLRDGKKHLHLIVPGGEDRGISTANNIKVAEKLGYPLFQRLRIEDHPDKPNHTLPNRYMILKMPIRKTQQTLEKKVNLPVGHKIENQLSGQVDGIRITQPELTMLLGSGYEKSVKEFFKIRGGDLGAINALEKTLLSGSKASQDVVMNHSSGVESSRTMNVFLLAMLVKTNIMG